MSSPWNRVLGLSLFAVLLLGASLKELSAEPVSEVRVGLIGLDTSHVVAFTKLLNAEAPEQRFAGCPIVAAYPQGSPDIESSVSRVPEYTRTMEQHGVEIVDSIASLLTRVDAVLLTTNDGRPHVEQALPVLRAKKRLFIDKPMAISLAEVMMLFDAAEHFGTPLFSSSGLRYGVETQAVAGGSIGKVLGADLYAPCYLEPTHPDFFWYGIHGVEGLSTVMGLGCESVSRTHTPDQDLLVGTWPGGRIGTMRGMRVGGYRLGGIAIGTNGVSPAGKSSGYEPLAAEIVKFLRGGPPPVSPEQTIEVFAMMEAADLSKARGGLPVKLEGVRRRAREESTKLRSW